MPAPGANLDLGHIGSPDMVGISRFGLGTRNLSFSLVFLFILVTKDHLLSSTGRWLLVNHKTLPVVEIGPTPAVTLEGVFCLQIFQTG